MIDHDSPLRLVLGFLTTWVFVSFVVSMAGGWFSLAQSYRADRAFAGQRWRRQSASFRYLLSYARILTIGGDDRGMHLSIMFLFRIGHPPLHIPWEEITKGRERLFGVRLKLRQKPSVPIGLSRRMVRRLEEIKGSEFPT